MRTTKTYHLKDIWEWYSFRILAANREWCGVNKDRVTNYYIYAKYTDSEGKRRVEEVMNYKTFSEIMRDFFSEAQQQIVHTGLPLIFNGKLGKIQPRRVQRDHSKKTINYYRTNQQPKVWSEEKQKMVPSRIIYFTTDDWCRIGWKKANSNRQYLCSTIRNLNLYEFAPTEDLRSGKGFNQILSKALTANPLLKYKYEYFPLRKRKTPQP